MGRLIAGLGLVGVLVILAVQNLSPSLTLVVLGTPTLTLPFSAWLLGSVAIGVVLTLLISALLQMAPPSRRPYRPLGQRVRPGDTDTSAHRTHRQDRYYSKGGTNDAANSASKDATNRYANTGYPDDADSPSANAFVRPEANPDTGRDDADWDDYRSPSQWEDWGQPPEPGTTVASDASEGRGFRFRQTPYRAETAMDEIGSGWKGYGDTDYDSTNDDRTDYDERPYNERSRYEKPAYDTSAYDEREGYRESYQDDYQDLASGWDDSTQPRPQVHPDGYLYGQNEADTLGEPASADDPEDVYDADFRVIIPPYDPNSESNRQKDSSSPDNP